MDRLGERIYMYPSREALLTEKIKEKAGEIGFDLVGITTAEPFTRARQVLKERELSEFISQDLELITTPRLHLPDARSIIALALSYASSAAYKAEPAYIALYARGRDYHRVMEGKMNELIEFIRELRPEAELVGYSDTGPLLDREAAVRAGLGWIGKNNNLINPRYGSLLVLGEILTDLELLPDKVLSGGCGSCRLCLESCPGGALQEPYRLLPGKCLSYLTQKKGFISPEEREMIGINLWGCDQCQLVCPYNRDCPVDLHPEFQPRLKADPAEVFGFTGESISREWRESALYWRGLRLLRRNSLINMSAAGNTENIPLIKEGLTDPSPVIRAYAAWALGKIGGPGTENILKEAAARETEPQVLEEITEALKKGAGTT